MDCPHCRVELRSKSISKTVVDECDRCKGIWFEADELRQAKDQKDPDLNWMDFEIWKHGDRFKAKSRDLSCPHCARNLVAIDYGNTGVEIDCCPSCKGVWLDRDEFEKTIEALTEELTAKPFSGYIKASLEEAKEVVTGPETFWSEWKDFLTVLRMMEYRLYAENPQLLDMLLNIQRTYPLK